MAVEAATSELVKVVALLGAAVVMVPLFRRAGLGSVLGYFAAGLAIGPFGLGWFSDPQSILHTAELGVVMFLFVIGLEMRPSHLWSLRKESWSAEAFQVADSFAINVLSEGQREVSDRFAKPMPDKFHSVGFALGKHNMPLIHGAIAQFECLKYRQLDGGDHWIFLGEVLDFSHAQGDPLIFHGGRYATAQPAAMPA